MTTVLATRYRQVVSVALFCETRFVNKLSSLSVIAVSV